MLVCDNNNLILTQEVTPHSQLNPMPIDPVFSLYFFSFTTFLLTTPPRPACHRIICTNLCLKIAPIDTINNYNPSQFDSNEYSTGCICCHDRLVQFGGKGGGGRGWGRGWMLAGPWSGMVVSQTLSNQLCVDRNYAG